MRTSLVRKLNNKRREAMAPLFPEHTPQQVVGHVTGLVAKNNKTHAVKMVRNALGSNTPDATNLVNTVEERVAEWNKVNFVATTKPKQS